MKFLLRLFYGIFSFFFKLATTIAVISMIMMGVAFSKSGNSIKEAPEFFASTVQSTFNQIERFARTSDVQNTGDHLTDVLSGNTSREKGNLRWNKATATIYIDPEINTTFQKAYLQAINNWNKTGAFTFVLTEDKSKADIIATENNDGTTSAVGLANTQANTLTNRLMSVTVTLNKYYLLDARYRYTYNRIVNTAEHELGHAIGLDHDDTERSVMQSAGSYFGIQQTDIDEVNALYQEA